MMKLQGQVALVTGSSTGIGAAIAIAFAEQGADIVVNYARDEAAAQHTVKAIKDVGREAVAIQADVSASEQVQRMFDQIGKRFGRIDILVNNAGISPKQPFEDVEEDGWNRIIDTNLKSVFLCTRYALPLMKQGGSILNISSVHATTTMPNCAVYAASKGGLESLTRGLAVDLGGRSIRVNAIRPGLIEVEREPLDRNDPLVEMICQRIPVGRPGNVNDIVGMAVCLCSGDASFITGQVIAIDGGQQITLNTPYPRGFVDEGALKP